MKEIIGKLDRRIALQVNTPSRDAFGSEVQAWSTLATVWASFKEATAFSKEDYESEQLTATTQVQFKIRHRIDINHETRISYNGKLYDIIKITEEGGRKSFLILTAETKD